jgi:hypothetical protein
VRSQGRFRFVKLGTYQCILERVRPVYRYALTVICKRISQQLPCVDVKGGALPAAVECRLGLFSPDTLLIHQRPCHHPQRILKSRLSDVSQFIEDSGLLVRSVSQHKFRKKDCSPGEFIQSISGGLKFRVYQTRARFFTFVPVRVWAWFSGQKIVSLDAVHV